MSSFHVEVVQKQNSRVHKDYIKVLVHHFVSNLAFVRPGESVPSRDLQQHPELAEHVSAVTFCDVEHSTDVAPTAVKLRYHVYRLDMLGAQRDTMADTTSGEKSSVADVWELPSKEFHGLWESLVYDSALKRDAVRLVECGLELSARGVDPHVVGCNRVLLLHGPPGTGKTSLCRALAQKLAVRLGRRFPRALLVEINAHGLFSRWFGESGKQVARLFERVHEAAANPRLLACVLVDEVESLAHARRAASAGLEPSDAVRAVNALLTQLDRLRQLSNVLVLTTSNVTGAIDVAFADRADIKQHVGPPSARAAYKILRGCCGELLARGVVASRDMLLELHVLESSKFTETERTASSLQVWEAARSAAAAAMSARALRRLPLLAHARLPPGAPPRLPDFLAALAAALRDHVIETEAFRRDEHAPCRSSSSEH